MIPKKMEKETIKTISIDNIFLKKIVFIYKKLKNIARFESIKIQNQTPKPADLTKEQLERIKSLEGKIGCRLVAYESDEEINERKNSILSQIELLLNEYINLCTNRKIENKPAFSKPKQKLMNNDFNGFFE